MTASIPTLSVIIPVLNEAASIALLLDTLSVQQGISLEVIIVDGGSRDDTVAITERFRRQRNLPLRILRGAAGRARQMNLGAQHARAPDLLFLHADTRFDDPYLMFNAQRHMSQYRVVGADDVVAGHFALRFARDTHTHSRAYYFYESKTRLNRPDCINGDQGFYLSRRFFQQLGCFDESLPYMEDARLAQQIFSHGKWVTLPGVVITSARRFESEGLVRRQILNAFLRNFNSIGADYFFAAAQDAYRAQDKTGPLRLRPFLNIAHRQMWNDGAFKALSRWYATGGYIADNSWQLAFAVDCRRNARRNREPGVGPAPALAGFDRYLEKILSSPPCRALTALLTLLWFYSLFIRYR